MSKDFSKSLEGTKYGDLRECFEGHLEAVVIDDEYKVKELFAKDRDIKYIIDIGANVGTASFKFHTFYPDAKILVVEADPELLEVARDYTNDKLTYIAKAVIGDDRKEVTFNVCKWAGNGHVEGHFRWDLFEPMGSKKTGEIKVPACTLKDLVDEYNFPRIDLLKVDTEGMESEILKSYKPYLKDVKHIRGEWHGDEERDLIRDILVDTHDVYTDNSLPTHGGFFAELKVEQPKVIDENIKRGIVVTTSAYTKAFLKDCLQSIKDVKYPITILSNDNYDPSEVIKEVGREVQLVINPVNGWEMAGIQAGKDNYDEFVHIMDTTVIKDISMFDKLFAIEGNVALSKGHFHYMGKYETAKLPTLPIITSKEVAIMLEAHWLKYYREFKPDLPSYSEVFEEVHGQRRMVLENIYMKKFKGTWQREQENEDKWF